MDPQIITIIVAIAGAAGAVLAFVAGRREKAASAFRQESSAAASISQSYTNLVHSLEERVGRIEDDYNKLREVNRKLSIEYDLIELVVTNLTKEKEILQARIDYLEARLIEIDNGLTTGDYNS